MDENNNFSSRSNSRSGSVESTSSSYERDKLQRQLFQERRAVICGFIALKSNVSFFSFISLMIVFLLAGGGIFYAIEYPADMRRIEREMIQYQEDKGVVMETLLSYTGQNSSAAQELYDELKAHSVGLQNFTNRDLEENHWDLEHSAIFSFTVVTTIGYGTFAPETSSGQMFLIVYALFGLPVAGLTLGFFAERTLYIFTWLSQVGSDKAEEAFRSFDADGSGFLEKAEFQDAVRLLRFNLSESAFETLWNGIDKDGGGTVNIDEFREAVEYMNADVTEASGRRTRVVVTIIGILFWIIVGMVVFMFTEKWPPQQSFYFVIVTLTTIGLGDLFPISRPGLYFLIFFALVGLGLIAVLFSLVEGFFRELKDIGEDSKKDPTEEESNDSSTNEVT